MTADRAAVDVVVVAYNSRDTLRELRRAARPRCRGSSVTVVDNACPERVAGGGRRPAGRGSCESDAQRRLRLRLQPGHGGGLGRVRAAAQPGRADRRRRSLDALVDALRADPRLAVVGPRTIDDGRRARWTQRRFPRLRSTYAQALFLQRARAARRLVGRGRPRPRPPTSTPARRSGCRAPACCCAARRSSRRRRPRRRLLPLLRGDRSLPAPAPRPAGASATSPRAVASHIGDASAPRDTTKHIRAHSRVRYARKHHGRARRAPGGRRASRSARDPRRRRGCTRPRPRARPRRRRPRRAPRHSGP